MDDLQRYLRQQAELGVKRVVLSGRAAGIVGRDAPIVEEAQPVTMSSAERLVTSPERTTDPAVAEPMRMPMPPKPENRPMPRTPAMPERTPAARSVASTDEAMPKWKKDAPAIYPAGFSIVSPVPDLIAGELEALMTLDAVAEHISSCRRCTLCETRTKTVPGEGNRKARLLCIGEGPGENEDLQGRPFIGKAGDLLNDILNAIELPRETIFIANVVKCRPPQNRKPKPDESSSCLPYLRRQIAILQPDVLLALGSTAAEALLGQKSPLGEMRGKVHTLDGRPLVVTYHPAALLRNPNWKKPTWDDVRVVRQLLDG